MYGCATVGTGRGNITACVLTFDCSCHRKLDPLNFTASSVFWDSCTHSTRDAATFCLYTNPDNTHIYNTVLRITEHGTDFFKASLIPITLSTPIAKSQDWSYRLVALDSGDDVASTTVDVQPWQC